MSKSDNKVVKRSYTKKDGTVITKTYKYSYSYKGSRNGKNLNPKPVLTKVKREPTFIRKRKDGTYEFIKTKYNEALEKVKAIEEQQGLNSLVNMFKAWTNMRLKEGKRTTYISFMAHNDRNELSRMLTNSGYSFDEIAQGIGVPIDELLKKENWKDEYFSYNGMTWKFAIRYSSGSFVFPMRRV